MLDERDPLLAGLLRQDPPCAQQQGRLQDDEGEQRGQPFTAAGAHFVFLRHAGAMEDAGDDQVGFEATQIAALGFLQKEQAGGIAEDRAVELELHPLGEIGGGVEGARGLVGGQPQAAAGTSLHRSDHARGHWRTV
jgi:hypothetical protein